MTTSADGQWVTLARATGPFRISDRTLRRQIAGGRHLIWIPSDPDTASSHRGQQNGGAAGRTAKTAETTAIVVNQDAVTATLREWWSLLGTEGERASQAEQAAAMWQVWRRTQARA